MSMDPQDATEHDYPHDDEDCNACGGSEQIEIVFQDHSRDYAACPVCLARDKNETIAAKDAEIERLRSALRPFAAAAALYDAEPNLAGHTCPLVGKPDSRDRRLTVGHLRIAARAFQQQATGSR